MMADNCLNSNEKGDGTGSGSDNVNQRDVAKTGATGTAGHDVERKDVSEERDSASGTVRPELSSSSPPVTASSTPANHLNGCLTLPATGGACSDPAERSMGRISVPSPSAAVQSAPRVEAALVQPNCRQGAGCGSPSRSGMHLNGLVSVCAHNFSLVSQANVLPGAGSVSCDRVAHHNGSGAFSRDQSADENFESSVPDAGPAPGPSGQCQRGARGKKHRRHTRKDDRQAKKGAFVVATPSDSDDDDTNLQCGVSLVKANAQSCSCLNGRLGPAAGRCNGDIAHGLPFSIPPRRFGVGRGVENLNEHLAQAPLAPPLASPRDDDLVDEGAVCDFDRNVLADESLIYSEDTSIPSPEEGANHRSNFLSGRALLDSGRPLLHHGESGGHCHYSARQQYNLSDSEEDLFGRGGGGGVRRLNENNAVQDMEDTGDFIDADLPVIPGQLMSSSADSASLSSANGDLGEQASAPLSCRRDRVTSHLENDLSGGSDKELNHNQGTPPDVQMRRDSARVRTSYSSPSHDGGFDNFLLPRDLSSSDGVFWNSSESENEEEVCEEGPSPDKTACCHDGPMMTAEGAGVAEAPVGPPGSSNQRLGGDPSPFGAGGDLGMCFQFDRACCLQENLWSPAGQSPARHCPHPHSHSHPHLAPDPPSEGEAGGACAPPPPVNNLSAARPGEAMANGLDAVAPSNFINDESNRQQKVFDKFPMVEEDRDGACGSGAGSQGKCDHDNVMCPCSVAPAPGIMYERPGDRASLRDQASLGTLGPNVESFGVPDAYKSPFGDAHWRANSESGVSEPAFDESYGYRLMPFADCCLAHDSRFQSVNKAGKDTKKKRIVCRPIGNGMDALPSVDRFMIWSEYEAYLLQVKQIGMSACGQTAVLNLLKAFELTADKDDVTNTIQVNFRKEKACVAEYLASRAIAGTTAEDLLSGVERLTKGEIRGRFFQLWPPRNVQLLTWLSQWMKKGAVPIATLNLQQGVKQQQQIPDAWHHQMVYGVGPRGVYLTNPLEIVAEETLLEQLVSDSVLLVRRQDLVSRFQPAASLAPLLHHPDPRWCTMNVLGQVVNVLREHNMPSVPGYRAQVTPHVRIPAVYRAGITLYVRHNTGQWKALRTAPDLPLMSSTAQAQ